MFNNPVLHSLINMKNLPGIIRLRLLDIARENPRYALDAIIDGADELLRYINCLCLQFYIQSNDQTSELNEFALKQILAGTSISKYQFNRYHPINNGVKLLSVINDIPEAVQLRDSIMVKTGDSFSLNENFESIRDIRTHLYHYRKSNSFGSLTMRNHHYLKILCQCISQAFGMSFKVSNKDGFAYLGSVCLYPLFEFYRDQKTGLLTNDVDLVSEKRYNYLSIEFLEDLSRKVPLGFFFRYYVDLMARDRRGLFLDDESVYIKKLGSVRTKESFSLFNDIRKCKGSFFLVHCPYGVQQDNLWASMTDIFMSTPEDIVISYDCARGENRHIINTLANVIQRSICGKWKIPVVYNECKTTLLDTRMLMRYLDSGRITVLINNFHFGRNNIVHIQRGFDNLRHKNFRLIGFGTAHHDLAARVDGVFEMPTAFPVISNSEARDIISAHVEDCYEAEGISRKVKTSCEFAVQTALELYDLIDEKGMLDLSPYADSESWFWPGLMYAADALRPFYKTLVVPEKLEPYRYSIVYVPSVATKPVVNAQSQPKLCVIAGGKND